MSLCCHIFTTSFQCRSPDSRLLSRTVGIHHLSKQFPPKLTLVIRFVVNKRSIWVSVVCVTRVGPFIICSKPYSNIPIPSFIVWQSANCRCYDNTCSLYITSTNSIPHRMEWKARATSVDNARNGKQLNWGSKASSQTEAVMLKTASSIWCTLCYCYCTSTIGNNSVITCYHGQQLSLGLNVCGM